VERFVEEALVLSSVDYGEADRIVTLFTRGRGRMSVFAAGARKSKRRFAGALEAGTHLKVQVVETRGDTHRLDGADILSSFHRVRDDLERIARALYCLELCRELIRDQQPSPELFTGLLAYLGALDRKEAGPTSLLKFELEALDGAGYRPSFSPCVQCGSGVGARPKFAPHIGGVACEPCALRFPQAFLVPLEVVQALAALQAGARVPLPANVRATARHLLNVFIEHHLGRRLKSVDFMLQVGTD
jgi:DNA repair protein RecO (recombination protein O)